jgi:type I restriction enzyme R subunit
MIATGTDVKPLEIVMFMRSVKSRLLFEQMKGRGVRVIGETDFQAVTPDAVAKERFVIVDAVGVTETDLVETQPLERQPAVPLDKLFKQISFGVRNPDLASTIAGRLARLDRRLTKDDREKLEQLAGGLSLSDITRAIVEAIDPDRQREATGKEEPSDQEVEMAAKQLLDAAVGPLATNPELRAWIIEARRSYEQAIDETSVDRLIEAGHSKDGSERARATVESFERFIEDHKDEITALQILYSRPYTQRLTFKEVKELANAIGRPPYQWTPEKLWDAYEALDRSKVRGSAQRVLADIVSLVRFALHQEGELVPYPDLVHDRYKTWLIQQENAGRTFTSEQLVWLERVRDHVAGSLAIATDDFAFTPFVEAGGLGKATQVFGEELAPLLDELNEALSV